MLVNILHDRQALRQHDPVAERSPAAPLRKEARPGQKKADRPRVTALQNVNLGFSGRIACRDMAENV